MSVSNNTRVGGRNPEVSDEPFDPEEVKAGKKTYDITTTEGLHAFKADIADGKLDGKAGQPVLDGVTFDENTNSIYAGDKTYNLDNDADVLAYRRDAADGRIDGQVGKGGGKEVNVGGKDYDLSTKAGRDAFEADWESGSNGIETNDGFAYDRKTNKITAGGGEKTYDLDDPAQRRQFQLDVRDGNLDGKRTAQDLRQVHVGGRDYDLSTRYGREEFAADWESGKINLETNDGFAYDPTTNKITAGGGERTYDLNDPAERAAFRKDIADGNLDGNATVANRKNVRVVGENYDLSTQAGRDKFAEDWDSGRIGVGTNDGFEYDKKTNKITAGGGEKTYDLDKPEDVRAFQRDIADGELDGVGGERAETPEHLTDVRVGNKSYDLSTEKGRNDFNADIADGKLDGKAKNKSGKFKGVDYDPERQVVVAGDRTYDLNNPKDFHDFKRDAADGTLGGEARRPASQHHIRG